MSRNWQAAFQSGESLPEGFVASMQSLEADITTALSPYTGSGPITFTAQLVLPTITWSGARGGAGGTPWLQIFNSTTDSASIHLTCGGSSGFIGPYLLGINASPSTNVTQALSNVAAAGNVGWATHLFSGDDANAVGFAGTGDVGSLGTMLQLESAGTGLIVFIDATNAIPAAGQKIINWQSAAYTGPHSHNMLTAYADGHTVWNGPVLVEGTNLAVSASDSGGIGDVNKAYLNSNTVAIYRYSGSTGLFYGGQIADGGSSAGGMTLNVSSAAHAVGGETWLPVIQMRRLTASTASIGFFAATPVGQQATTGTATGFTAGAGTAVTDQSTFTGATGTTAYRISDIVLALKNYGLLAA